MEQSKRNTIAALLRKAAGLPAKGSGCCGNGVENEDQEVEVEEAGGCCDSKRVTPPPAPRRG